MIFSTELLDQFTAQAKQSERHRQHYDLRDFEELIFKSKNWIF